MSIQISTTTTNQTSSHETLRTDANEIRKRVESALPGSSVTVAKIEGLTTFGFFIIGAEPPSSTCRIGDFLKDVKRLAPTGITLSFNYKEASEEQLREYFLVSAPENHSIKFKGFKHLTPSFMKDLASARPYLKSLDLRSTPETYKLADAYLAEQKERIDSQAAPFREEVKSLLQQRNNISEWQLVGREKQRENQIRIQKIEEELLKIEGLESHVATIQNPSKVFLQYADRFRKNRASLENELSQLEEENKRFSQDLQTSIEKAETLNTQIAKCRSSFFDVDCTTIVVKITSNSLSLQERKELEQKYPDVAFIDESTHLDLSGTTLPFDKIRKKIAAQPALKTLDLTDISELDSFALLCLEKELGLKVTYRFPENYVAPKMTGIEGETKNPSIHEIEELLQRCEIKSVDLRSVKDLTLIDLLYLEDTFPERNFVAPVEMLYTLPIFDQNIVEKLCIRFPTISIQLLNLTVEEEVIITNFVSSFPLANFINGERLTLLLREPDLMKFYLARALMDDQKSTLSQFDLESLAIQCPSIAPTIERICEYRNKEKNHSLVNLRLEIANLKVVPAGVSSQKNSDSKNIPYSLQKLIKKYGVSNSNSTISAATPELENSLGEKLRVGNGVPKNEKEAVVHFTSAADKGYAPAQYNLGIMLLSGEGVPRNEADAVKYLTQAANQSHLSAQCQLAFLYEMGRGVSHDDKEAVRLYALAAEQKSEIALCNLANMYRDGRGVTQDYQEAVKLYRLAAEKGSSDALCNLGFMYQLGMGVGKSAEEAVRLFEEAADRGHCPAQYQTGLMYEFGNGVPNDNSRAVLFYWLAANQGHSEAQRCLGSMYEWGKGADKNESEAVKYYTLAAEQMNVAAQYRLGFMYEHGKGVTQNYTRAAQYYTLACNQRYAAAQNSLAHLHEIGKGVGQNIGEAKRLYKLAADQKLAEAQTNYGRLVAEAKDATSTGGLVEAERYYKLAADRGFVEAQWRLAFLYKAGLGGVKQDYKEAIKYFTLAAVKGDATGQSALGYMYERGTGVSMNFQEAARLYKLAAVQGNRFAQNDLGRLYACGIGVNKDLVEAIKYYTLAANQGHPEAKNSLESLKRSMAAKK